uniref:Uncharacterized protein n=1 Tax=Trypanosoma congolense (strain IL3000) TaxID=1068625 RepID=G0USI3_TRYCI|nr:conserved hypothetical protein [Trypanosoma congolense IL3000]
MPLRGKKEEVCGKPTQYNLQTCEYDWRTLPDTHFALGRNKHGRRNVGILPQLLEPPEPPRRHVVPPPPIERPQVYERQQTPPPLPPPPQQYFEPLPYLVPWSHDTLRQVILLNNEEAQRSYLRMCD